MKNNIELSYDQDAHEQFKFSIKRAIDLLNEAKEELANQNIDKVFTLQDLKDGNFVEKFTKHHKTKQKKMYPDFLYEAYIKNCGLSTTKLETLQNSYKKLIEKDIEFYPLNHSFYSHCEWNHTRNPKLRAILEKAPKKKTYSIDDFLSISKDTYRITAPKNLFTLYVTSSKQTELINHIRTYLEACKGLGFDYLEAKKPISKYVKDLNRDFNGLKLNHDEILSVQ
ncbi:hypothetical protein [Oceanihabitans sediminis]|uniref:hypothetical protein n=1 Tax=Oceanihabitans sediminis TaxID=1812012 RepID=UPI00299D8F49|nr:hypothetical protein [Oceanihabitans sediminis]MDX1772652.1 hypothetical protein [Oceanihabitans sediminis]